jgi:hypothetical protein
MTATGWVTKVRFPAGVGFFSSQPDKASHLASYPILLSERLGMCGALSPHKLYAVMMWHLDIGTLLLTFSCA